MDSAEQPHRCKCKVGSCPLCGSACKRCGCACDGVEPGVALARSSGQRGPKRLSTGSEQREAAKRARIEIAKTTDLEERTIGTEPTIKQVETVHDLWQAFGWSQATKKKLPNEDMRKGVVLLKESGGSGWSTMVQSVLAAVVRCAEILYPANSDSLLEEVAARLSQSSSSITTKDKNRVTGRAYLEPYKKDIKRMFERRARVSSDKMSPCAMLEEFQSLYPGRYTLPGENEIRAEITKLFGRKKASDEDNAGSDHDESENEATKGRGSNLPKQYVKHLEELVERNPTIKPAEALKAALCLPHPFEHDKAIKTKVSSLKRKIKVREKANIL